MSKNYKNPYEILLEKNAEMSESSPEEGKKIEMGTLSGATSKDPKPQPEKEMKEEYNPLELSAEFEQAYQTRYSNLKIVQKIKRLLTPFAFPYRQKWVEKIFDEDF